MFRPLDTTVFDTDWPLIDARVHNLRDIGVTIHTRPSNASWRVPSEVVVTAVTPTSITVALADRENLSVYSGTALIVSGVGQTGGIYRASNSVMTVTITTGGELSTDNTLPALIMPSCVMWLVTEEEEFDPSIIPTPRNGWTRIIDNITRRITYVADEPIETGALTDGRLRLVNGLSSPTVPFTADGEGQIIVTDNSITIKPAERTDP